MGPVEAEILSGKSVGKFRVNEQLGNSNSLVLDWPDSTITFSYAMIKKNIKEAMLTS